MRNAEDVPNNLWNDILLYSAKIWLRSGFELPNSGYALGKGKINPASHKSCPKPLTLDKRKGGKKLGIANSMLGIQLGIKLGLKLGIKLGIQLGIELGIQLGI